MSRTVAEIERAMAAVRDHLEALNPRISADRSSAARARQRLAVLAAELDRAREAAAQREASTEAYREAQAAHWERERIRRRTAHLDHGGDAAEFDRRWPSIQAELIEEAIEAARNHPRLMRASL